MRSLTAALTSAALLLALPVTANAATFIGSDFSNFGSAVGQNCSVASGCGRVADKLEGAFVEAPHDGVITEWSVKGMDGEMALQTYRTDIPWVDGELHATLIAGSAVESAAAGAPSYPINSFGTQIPVVAGDYIGLALADGSDFSVRNAPGGEDTRTFTVDPNDDHPDATSGSAQELFLQAKVEADADGDGLGDESQDPCVGCGGNALPGPQPSSQPAPPAPDPYAAIRAKGPSISISGSATMTGRTAALKLRNPYGFPLRGTVDLQPVKGARKSARKKFTLAAGATKTVKVKLSRATSRQVRRRRRLRMRAVAKVKAPVGKTRTVKKLVAVKVKPKRRRRPGGTPNAPTAPLRSGSYAGSWTSDLSSAPGSGQVTFTVADGGVTNFTAPGLDIYCSGTFGGTAKKDFKAGDTRAAVNSDGSFSAQVKDKNEQGETLTFEGKLTSGGEASGRLRYLDVDYGANYTTCSGSASWTARSG